MRAYYKVTQLNCEDVFSVEIVNSGWKVVLPDRFELSTSPLPMECSTPELRQRVAILWQVLCRKSSAQPGRAAGDGRQRRPLDRQPFET